MPVMHHLVTGPADAPALVLSNSLGTSTGLWDPQVEPLSERFRVVRYDHRGHGGSPVPPGPYQIADLGRDVVELLDHVEIERASFGGVSLGGMVGMWLGVHAPERIDRLVLCCTSAHLPPAGAWAERAAAVREAGSTAPVADAVLERWLTPAGAASDPERLARLREMLLAIPAEGYASCCGVIERLDLRDSLPAIAAPTLAIAGAQDPATPPEHLQAIADAVPDARLEILDGAAHLANVEQPEEVTRLILEHCGGRASTWLGAQQELLQRRGD
jgi:3-oxoadipate enol-lactonase